MIVKHIYYILYYMALVETLTNTQRYELKKKIAELRSVKGEGTTLVTLAIKAGTTSVQMSSKIKDEIGLASNIKSAQTSKDVCDALESASNVLKKYSGSGSLEKGLIIFAGNGITMDGKPKRFNIGIEPPLPCPNPLYRCENHFKTEILEGMLIDKRAFGIIIIDRGSCFYGIVSGDTKRKLDNFTSDIPKKHDQGGQSQNRIQRLRKEKIHAHLVKAGERARQNFMDSSNVPKIEGLILGGPSDLKNHLGKNHLPTELKNIILQTVDVSYSGEAGFSAAIDLASEAMGSLKYIQEKKILQDFFVMFKSDEDQEKLCYGFNNVEIALNTNAIKTLIIWEDLDILRREIVDPTDTDNKKTKIIYSKEKMNDVTIIKSELFIDWITKYVEENNIDIEYVTDHTEEGAQFKAFGGVGGIMHWALNLDYAMIEDDTELDDFI